MATDELIEQKNNRGHLFKKGVSGNPLGRPKGIGKIGQIRNQISEALPEIVDKLIADAKTGDIQSARLLVDKVIPSVRPQSLPVAFELSGESLLEGARGVLDAAMRGELSLDQASDFLLAANDYLRLKEFHELEDRLFKLEQAAERASDEKTFK